MGFTLIGKEDWVKIYEELPAGKQTCGDCRVAITEAQRQHTLKEVFDELEKYGNNYSDAKGELFYGIFIPADKWQELRKEAGV